MPFTRDRAETARRQGWQGKRRNGAPCLDRRSTRSHRRTVDHACSAAATAMRSSCADRPANRQCRSQRQPHLARLPRLRRPPQRRDHTCRGALFHRDQPRRRRRPGDVQDVNQPELDPSTSAAAAACARAAAEHVTIKVAGSGSGAAGGPGHEATQRRYRRQRHLSRQPPRPKPMSGSPISGNVRPPQPSRRVTQQDCGWGGSPRPRRRFGGQARAALTPLAKEAAQQHRPPRVRRGPIEVGAVMTQVGWSKMRGPCSIPPPLGSDAPCRRAAVAGERKSPGHIGHGSSDHRDRPSDQARRAQLTRRRHGSPAARHGPSGPSAPPVRLPASSSTTPPANPRSRSRSGTRRALPRRRERQSGRCSMGVAIGVRGRGIGRYPAYALAL